MIKTSIFNEVVVKKNSEEDVVGSVVKYLDLNQMTKDGSNIIYAESKEKIVIYHNIQNRVSDIYVFDRHSKKIKLNGYKGTNKDKLDMIELGTRLIKQVNNENLYG